MEQVDVGTLVRAAVDIHRWGGKAIPRGSLGTVVGPRGLTRYGSYKVEFLEPPVVCEVDERNLTKADALVIDDEDWKDLTEQLKANGLHDETALVDVDPTVSREELWQRLRIVARAYQQKMIPTEYRKAKALTALLAAVQGDIKKLTAENSRLRVKIDELLGEVPEGVSEAVQRSHHAERNALIYQLRKDGKTLKAISDEVGVSRERVRQVVAKAERMMRLRAEGRLETDE